jgi:hypothetical protein
MGYRRFVSPLRSASEIVEVFEEFVEFLKGQDDRLFPTFAIGDILGMKLVS